MAYAGAGIQVLGFLGVSRVHHLNSFLTSIFTQILTGATHSV